MQEDAYSPLQGLCPTTSLNPVSCPFPSSAELSSQNLGVQISKSNDPPPGALPGRYSKPSLGSWGVLFSQWLTTHPCLLIHFKCLNSACGVGTRKLCFFVCFQKYPPLIQLLLLCQTLCHVCNPCSSDIPRGKVTISH